MRRSAAPSSRQSLPAKPFGSNSNNIFPVPVSSPLTNHSSLKTTVDIIHPLSHQGASTVPAVRSTASVLSLLSKVGKSSESAKALENSDNVSACEEQSKGESTFCNQVAHSALTKPAIEEESTISDKRIFRVVWGKPTAKKHKTWEGDGTLEIENKSATLKDEDGKVLGRATQIKTCSLEEGSRLKVGSKEVELIDLLSSSDHMTTASLSSSTKRNLEETPSESATSWKKIKKTPKPLFSTDSCDPFVLPTPSHVHQWEFNVKKLPVKPVVVDGFLSRVLRPHQKEGVVFLYECVMGMRNVHYRGAILADEMGLGKTLQTITLIWTLLRQGPYGGHPVVRRILVVTPSSLVLNWHNEFNRWLGKHRLQTFAVDQKNKVSDFVRLSHLPVMLVSYEMLLRNFDEISKIKFDLMVCDEGHRLKNNSIRTSLSLNQLDVSARVLLTGTPIQNDLQEFYALVTFVNPDILGSLPEFRNYFEGPIIASQQPNCPPEERLIGEERALELNSRTSCFILRRTQSIINKYLPSKTEAILFVKPTQIQKILYKAALDWWENQPKGMGEVSSHLGVITALKKICNHPALIRCLEHKEDESKYDVMPHDSLLQDLSSIFNTYEAGAVAVHHSGKLTLVRQLLEQLVFLRERIVLVSYFTQTLDILAALCDEMGLGYSRLDGSTPTAQRTTIVGQFNAPYSKHTVFLLSARAGGMGLNLTGASRLVLYDSDWNPASDAQAMSRVWRDGQKHCVFIYRLLTCGSIEEKIFQRQLSKVGLSGAVVDPQKRCNVKLSNEELKDLFTFHDGEESLTHSLLKCSCYGNGTVPTDDNIPEGLTQEEKENDDRDCKLFVGVPSQIISQNDNIHLRMTQLFKWQHHSPPFNEKTLQTLGLLRASKLLAFMFVAPVPVSV